VWWSPGPLAVERQGGRSVLKANYATGCRQCGCPIVGSYVNALGHFWHPNHFTCQGCGRPIGDGEFHTHQGGTYHSECFARQVAPKCAYCKKPLTKAFVKDYWGLQFCTEHRGQFPPCAYCSRLVDPAHDGGSASKGGIRCVLCKKHAVEDQKEAELLFREAVAWCAQQGVDVRGLRFPLEICGRSTLNAYFGGSGGAQHLGVTRTSRTSIIGVVSKTEIIGVAILLGLPKTLFRGVAAHELGHAWLRINNIGGLASSAEEGFCELLAFRQYMQIDTIESRYYANGMEQNPDPTYGGGFRRVREIALRGGFQQLLTSLRSNRSLPELI